MTPMSDKESSAADIERHLRAVEELYGHPIEHWLGLIRESPMNDHKELVEWLKSEHGMGDGHASAVVQHSESEA